MYLPGCLLSHLAYDLVSANFEGVLPEYVLNHMWFNTPRSHTDYKLRKFVTSLSDKNTTSVHVRERQYDWTSEHINSHCIHIRVVKVTHAITNKGHKRMYVPASCPGFPGYEVTSTHVRYTVDWLTALCKVTGKVMLGSWRNELAYWSCR